jgi:Meiotically up-regulated gene 113
MSAELAVELMHCYNCKQCLPVKTHFTRGQSISTRGEKYFCDSCNHQIYEQLAKEIQDTEREKKIYNDKCRKIRIALSEPLGIFVYILSLKDEPIVKVGRSVDIVQRARELGINRFDLEKSYSIRTTKEIACELERELKRQFAPMQLVSEKPLKNANSETFHVSALPEILKYIDLFMRTHPPQIKRDLSSLFEEGVLTNGRTT